MLAGIVCKPLVIRKFSANSLLFVQYYYWVYILGFGLLIYSVLEGLMWALQKTVITNFLKETMLRFIITLCIALYYFKIIQYDSFIKLFSFTYLIIAILLIAYLIKTGHFSIHFKASRVTKKFRKKMFTMQSLLFGGIVVQALGSTIDGILISGLKGLGDTAVFTLAQYTANIVQVPQRSIYSISTGFLSRAWKDKRIDEINRIYQRSSINMLLISLFLFGLIWLSVQDGLHVLNLWEKYAAGLQIVFVLGIARIIDAGTGVNSIIIATSNFWRF